MGSDGLYTFCGFSAGVYPSCGGKFCIGWNPAEIFEIKAVGEGGGRTRTRWTAEDGFENYHNPECSAAVVLEVNVYV